MYGFRKKYQRSDNNGENNEVKEIKTTTTTVIETKIEKPKVIKVEEQKVVIEKDQPKSKYSRMPKASGRASAIFSLKRDNDLIIKTTMRERSKEKDRNSNKEKEKESEMTTKTTKFSTKPNFRWSVVEQKVEKEPIKWRRYNRKKEEKLDEKNESKEIKTIKEETIEKAPNDINTTITKTTIIEDKQNKNEPEGKVIKTEVTIIKKEVEPPKELLNEKEEPQKIVLDTKIEPPKEILIEKVEPKKEEIKEKEEPPKIVLNAKIEPPKEIIIEKIETKKEEIKEKEEPPKILLNAKIEPPQITLNEKIEPPKMVLNTKIEINNKNDSNPNIEKEKVKYNYNRNKLRTNRTDEDLIPKKNEKEEVKVEAKKRKTLATTFIPGSRKLLEEKASKKSDEKNKNKYKSENKRKIIKEEKIEENINENEQKEKRNRLKIALNEIEKASAEKILKKDLVELFEKVLESNLEFKDKIFFKNLCDTAKKVGNMDSDEISHTYKENETRDIIRSIDNADNLMKKYTTKARRIIEED